MGLFDKLFKKAEPAKASCGTITCEPKTVYAPVLGTAVALDKVSDPVFSTGAMGPGVGINPKEGKLWAPLDGEVSAVFPTNHAVGIASADGIDMLLHIGVDTVNMQGKGFKGYVKAGDKVKAGDLLVEFDIDAIKAAGYDPVVMVLATNADDIGTYSDEKLGEVAPLDKLYCLK